MLVDANPVSGVNAHRSKRAVEAFLDAARMGKAEFAEWLGHQPSWMHHLFKAEWINSGTERTIFAFIYRRWPEGKEMPPVITSYARKHLVGAPRNPLDPTKGAKMRKCMTCSTSFESEGIHNRMCNGCRSNSLGKDFL